MGTDAMETTLPTEVRRKVEIAMLEAVQIDIALWGMIACLAVKAAQWF
jgi:hypothetical protein